MSERLHPQIQNAYWFQGFNATCWQICLGAPLILFARFLGASATAIGLLAGLAPLLNAAQWPASQYVDQIGYRKMMLAGWSFRVGTLILLALLPLVAYLLPHHAVVNLLLCVIFAFNLLRGISLCAWLPWLSALVPETLRGTYLGRERIYINVAAMVALMTSGTILQRESRMWTFALLFFIGFAAGAISLYFLKRIPEPAPVEKTNPVTVHFSWKTTLEDIPFRNFLVFNILVQIALSANGPFTLLFLKEQMGMGDGRILWLTAAATLLGMLAVKTTGTLSDRLGSKPFMGLVFVWWIGYLFLWVLISVQGLRHAYGIAQTLMVLGGFFGTIFDLSSTRLLINLAGGKPAKTFFFSFYSVVVSLVLGVAPVIWGMILDALPTGTFSWMGHPLNRYALFFGAEWLLLGTVGVALARLKESKGESAAFIVHQIFIGMPARTISYLFQQIKD